MMVLGEGYRSQRRERNPKKPLNVLGILGQGKMKFTTLVQMKAFLLGI